MKFGFDYERIVTNNDWEFCSLGCAGVYSPETTLAQANPAFLGSISAESTEDDLLNGGFIATCRSSTRARRFTAASTWDMATSRALSARPI